MKRIKLTKAKLKALLSHYEAPSVAYGADRVQGSAITYRSATGQLVAVVFFNQAGDISQAFIPDYVEKCPIIANSPCAGARVERHGTG